MITQYLVLSLLRLKRLVLVEVEAEPHALLLQPLVDEDFLHAGVDHLPLLGGDVEPLPALQWPLVRTLVVGLDQPGAVGGDPLAHGVVADAQLTQQPARPRCA
jgi:hypothetical protein